MPRRSALILALAIAAAVMSSSAAYAGDLPVATVSVGATPACVAVDPVSHNVFVGNYYGDSVSVIDGATRSTIATVPMPTAGSIAVPITAAVDVLSGRAYVGNFWSNYVSVIDGWTCSAVATISLPSSHGAGVRALGLDPSGSALKVYAAIYGKNVVSVIDGSSNTVTKNIPVGSAPRALAVSASGSRRRVYVANRYGNSVSIIDGSTDSVVATVPTGVGPKAIAVDADRGFAYVSSPTSDTVTVIDDRDEATKTIPVGDNPVGIGVDSVGRRVFVANYLSNSVSVIDADTLSVVATVATGVQPIAVAVDRSSRKVYVSCQGGGSVTIIDSSLAVTSAAAGPQPYALGIDESLASHQVYCANSGGNTVTVIDPPGGDSGSIRVVVDPLPNDTTSARSLQFTGSASSVRAPYASDIVAVYYRVDAEDQWHQAEITGGAGSSAVTWRAVPVAPFALGPHSIRVVAIDQALAVSSSSDQGATAESPSLGEGTTYGFAVAATVNTPASSGWSLALLGIAGLGVAALAARKARRETAG
jgi:YVTN family beta-propeller protein